MHEYLAIVRHRWLSISVFTILGLLVAAGYTATAPRTYTGNAQSFVALSGQNNDSNPLNDAQFAAQRVKSYTELISSPGVLKPVIDELKLSDSEQQLAARMSSTNPPLTVLINVSATDSSPDRAAAIANAASIQLGKMIEKLETPPATTVPAVRVTLTEPAVPPTSPSSPKTTFNLVLGLLVGLAVGVLWALLRSSLDRTIKRTNELEAALGCPSLGAILYVKRKRSKPNVLVDHSTAEAEGYRVVRTNLSYVDVDDPPHVITVTGASPNDGKTYVACNLAASLAYAGHTVCLLEADLRRPRVAEYFGLDNSVGLTDVLVGHKTVEEVTVHRGVGLPAVVTSGPIPPNPSELLGSQVMADTIETLRDRFAYVIIDTSPLLVVADAAVLSAQTDGTILVVRYGATTRDQVAHAGEALRKVNCRLLGTILNAVPDLHQPYEDYSAPAAPSRR